VAVGHPGGACGRADQGQLSGPVGPGRRRRGPEKAALAVAHSILVIAWQFLPATSPISGRRTPAVVCGLWPRFPPMGDCCQHLGLPSLQADGRLRLEPVRPG
jgi:hypothetical protein